MSSQGAASADATLDKVEATSGGGPEYQQQQQQQTKRTNQSSGCGEADNKAGSMLRLNQQETMWGEQLLKAAVADMGGAASDHDGSDSELSDSEQFLAKGAFLLTPSHELSIEKASTICEKMNFKGLFSLTKTATGILFKFSEPEDFQAVFKKGFHKVTGARFYKKVPIPCRPQKTFSVFVLEIPEDIPEEDIRHSLYKFHSVVEVTRLPKEPGVTTTGGPSSSSQGVQQQAGNPALGPPAKLTSPPPISDTPCIVRVTLANLEESNILLQNGLDFYGATFFPTESAASTTVVRATGRKSVTGNRILDVVTSSGQRVRDLLPVFDAASFSKIPPPTTKTIKPRNN